MGNNEKEPDVVTFEELEREMWKRRIKGFFKEAPRKTYEFARAHGKELAAAVPTVLMIGGKLIRTREKWSDNWRKDHEIYDYSLHRWCRLKRKMTKREELEYKERLRNGEKVYDILNTMRLLKY